MNRLRQLCLTAALTLTLSLSAYAGEIECGVAPPPLPVTNEMGGVESVLNVVLAVLAAL